MVGREHSYGDFLSDFDEADGRWSYAADRRVRDLGHTRAKPKFPATAGD
jgi:hypothetical protein